MRLAGCGFLPWYGSSTRRFAHRGGGFLVLLFVLRCSLCSCACAPLVCLSARAAATVASVIKTPRYAPQFLQVAFQARSSFAKGNPFSLFFRGPLFLGPLVFFFFLFFLSPAKVGSLEMQPGAKLQAYLGVSILQPRACTQRFRLRILRRTRSNAGRTSAGSLSGRI